jgi:hypothetical protein
MDDVLIPLCQKYNVNLVTGTGFLSITSVINLLERIKRIEKPTRIFYISDFDPAGNTMPISVARQIEFWLHNYGMDDNVKLTPLVLTKEQIDHYKLPRAPIKDTDRRKGNFEQIYGEGATELDALEALYPGELGKIVTQAILKYRDPELSEKLDHVNEEFEEELTDELDEVVGNYQGQVEEIENKMAKILGDYRERINNLSRKVDEVLTPFRGTLKQLSDNMDKELTPYKERLEFTLQDIRKSVDEIDVEPPELPKPETSWEDDNWLFDSRRDYLEQLEYYKAYKEGNDHNEY